MRPALALVFLALAACNKSDRGASVTVEGAEVRLPAVPGRPGAAYFTLKSSTGAGQLVAVSSPRVARTELHETRTERGIARMAPIAGAAFDASGTIAFAPGGKHVMLHGIDPALKAGDRLPLTLRFEGGAPLTADAEVRAFNAQGHAGH